VFEQLYLEDSMADSGMRQPFGGASGCLTQDHKE